MNWDESFFRAINGMAGQSAMFDWLMVELAKPGNLLYPDHRRSGILVVDNRRECVIGSVMLAGVVGATDALGTQLQGFGSASAPLPDSGGGAELLGCGGAFSFPFQSCG